MFTLQVLARATVVIWCDAPALLRAFYMLRRSIWFMGRTRPEHPPGNRDWPGRRQTRFLYRALTAGPRFSWSIAQSLREYAGPVVRLRTRADTSVLIKAAREGAKGL